MSQSAIKLAVLVSGSGTTLQNLIDRIRDKKLDAEVCVVIASRPGIKGIDRAKDAGIACHTIERKKFGDTKQFSQKLFETCGNVDLVCLAGWLSLLEIPTEWAGKVMNIHPALLPSFGGAGMYGPRVHQAVLDYGCKVSGCTVHLVNDDYDSGPIVVQRCCAVLEDDTADTLAHRVFEEEKIAYPQAISLYQSKMLKVEGRCVRIGRRLNQRASDRD